MSKIRKQQQKKLEGLQDKLEHYQTSSNDRPFEKDKAGERLRARKSLIDRIIQEAIDRGEFDNLPGKGKPLEKKENPYQEPGQAWGFDLLKRNGFAPEWIERDKEIRKLTEQARLRLTTAWQDRREQRMDEAKWHAVVSEFEEQLHKINQKIDDFNLIVPMVSLQRSRLRLSAELQHIQQDSM